jgi:hypothetical protein
MRDKSESEERILYSKNCKWLRTPIFNWCDAEHCCYVKGPQVCHGSLREGWVLFFDSMFHSKMDGKIEQCVCIKFDVKPSKSTTETLEMFHVAFGEHSLSWTVVFG